MSHLQYFSYPGFGDQSKENFHYNQAVRIRNRIEISGQGGWDPDTGAIPEDINEQVDQTFKNVDLALRTAGGKGWSQVYKIRMYLAPRNEESLAAAARNLKAWMPDHMPILTGLPLTSLALDGMKIEIEVVADLGES